MTPVGKYSIGGHLGTERVRVVGLPEARRNVLFVVACADLGVEGSASTALLVGGLSARAALVEIVAVGGIGPDRAALARVAAGGNAVDEEGADEDSESLVGEAHFGLMCLMIVS